MGELEEEFQLEEILSNSSACLLLQFFGRVRRLQVRVKRGRECLCLLQPFLPMRRYSLLRSADLHVHVHLPAHHHAHRRLSATEVCLLHRSPCPRTSHQKAKMLQRAIVEGCSRRDVFPDHPLHDPVRCLCLLARTKLAQIA